MIDKDNKIVVSDAKDLDKERIKLENIIRNNDNDGPNYESLRVKLQFIHWLLDQIGNSENESGQFKDEL